MVHDSSAANFRRMVLRATLLGIASLLLNHFAQRANVPAPLPIGNVFLFMSASAFGIIGGTISALVSELPRLILETDSGLFIIKNISIAGILGLVTTNFPRFPSAIAIVLFWIVGMSPTLSLLGELDSPYFVLLFLCDLLFLGLAKLALLSSSILGWLNGRLPRLSLQLLLPECLFVVTAVCGGALLIMPAGERHGYQALSTFAGSWAPLIIGLLALLPMIIGTMLTNILLREYGPDLETALQTQRGDGEFGFRSRPTKHSLVRTSESQEPIDRVSTTKQAQSFFGELTVNEAGTITFLNTLFREYANLQDADGLGAPLASLTMHQQLKDAISELLAEKPIAANNVREVRAETERGSPSRFLEVTCSSSTDLETDERRFHFRLRDITERRTVEGHLLQAKKMESLGMMVNGLAHSFGDALTSMAGYASVARETKDPLMTRQALDEIVSASHRAGELVQQLLDFALDSTMNRKTEDILAVFRSRSEFFSQSVGDSFTLRIEHSVNALPVECNHSLLLQAITNLVINAKESYPDGLGEIMLHFDIEEIPAEVASFQPGVRQGRFARIRVKDAGTGMSAEHLANAFDPLFTTKASSGHSGLGLSIVFAIVREHDGFLTAESELGRGTTISLYLPLNEGHTEVIAKPERAETSEPSLLQGKRILVVEDDESVRAVVEILLKSLGCTPLIFGCAREALDATAREQFELFIADLVLPGMGGRELADVLRERRPHCPGILMSGYTIDESARRDGLRTLRKPFDLSKLRSALLEALTCMN